MTYDLSRDIKSCFADFGVPATWTPEGTQETHATIGHFFSPGKNVDLGGVSSSTAEPYFDFPTVDLPDLGAGDVLTITLTPAQIAMFNAGSGANVAGPEVQFRARNATPQDGGYITRATLKRVLNG